MIYSDEAIAEATRGLRGTLATLIQRCDEMRERLEGMNAARELAAAAFAAGQIAGNLLALYEHRRQTIQGRKAVAH